MKKIIRLPEVLEIIQLSKPTVYRLMKEGKFPRQRKIGAKAVGWLDCDVSDWLDQLGAVA